MIAFSRPFSLKGLGRILPPGRYEVVTDEELVEGLSFPVYRRVATMIMARTATSAIEMLTIDPLDLADAIKRDVVAMDPYPAPTPVSDSR
jgi:hypothetical protein